MGTQEQVEVATLPASRDLDALVAEQVMGGLSKHEWDTSYTGVDFCHVCQSTGDDLFYGRTTNDACIPHYSTSMAAAWEIVQHFFAKGHTVVLFAYAETHPVRHKPEGESYCCEMHHPEQRIAFGRADTAPLAICRAALRAVMEKP